MFILNGPEDTMELGRILAKAMCASPVRNLYLFAGLGGGKTTFTRGFVAALPGGETAEVSSPSFTLCNVYPTDPEVLHADLYRLSEGVSLPEEMDDMMEEGDPLLVLEWPEYLARNRYAEERLELRLEADPEVLAKNLDNSEKSWETKRLAILEASGIEAQALLRELLPRLERRFIRVRA